MHARPSCTISCVQVVLVVPERQLDHVVWVVMDLITIQAEQLISALAVVMVSQAVTQLRITGSSKMAEDLDFITIYPRIHCTGRQLVASYFSVWMGEKPGFQHCTKIESILGRALK